MHSLPLQWWLLLLLICGFLPVLNIVSEKEFGTIEQINVPPVSKFTFILAKLIPYWVAGMIILTLGVFLRNDYLADERVVHSH